MGWDKRRFDETAIYLPSTDSAIFLNNRMQTVSWAHYLLQWKTTFLSLPYSCWPMTKFWPIMWCQKCCMGLLGQSMPSFFPSAWNAEAVADSSRHAGHGVALRKSHAMGQTVEGTNFYWLHEALLYQFWAFWTLDFLSLERINPCVYKPL